MSLVDTYAPYLPYLRRFSRALTGSQAEGDRYVRTALEALVAGDAAIDDTLPARTALYRMFLGIWNSTGAQLESPASNDDSPTERIRRLTPKSRQAFLLSALEGLSVEDIAGVMNATEEDARELLAQAEADIEKELRTNVLIIEDEPIIAADIEELVGSLGHTVDGIAATHTEAVRMAREHKPGIVLADVQLADGSSGIDAVDDILGEYDVPVIFITAFPERLLTGDKPEPAYLISKPFKPSNVKAAISQALFFHD
ncbi:response regulator [Algimonas porphyrae]|uniref:Response regulator n=1 Tax=Algimonas porphyrae TaxID=1128113 RepID=A0ABQ5V374_9PROT|nr:response regulator [Algimonas porphyrae]GLQ21164.1 response regulator [Algimonas porphyrae]